MNSIQTLRLLPARQAQHIDLKEDTQLSLPDVRVSSCACFGRGRLRPPRFHHCVPPPPHLQEEPGKDLEDSEEDSCSESGSSLDNQDDWAPVYRPHFGSHANQLPLKGQHLSDTEEARRPDEGDEAKETWTQRPLDDDRFRQRQKKNLYNNS